LRAVGDGSEGKFFSASIGGICGLKSAQAAAVLVLVY
jgi:hypothetical protein